MLLLSFTLHFLFHYIDVVVKGAEPFSKNMVIVKSGFVVSNQTVELPPSTEAVL